MHWEYIVKIENKNKEYDEEPDMKEISNKYSNKQIILLKGNLVKNIAVFEVWLNGNRIKQKINMYTENFMLFCRECGVLFEKISENTDDCFICDVCQGY